MRIGESDGLDAALGELTRADIATLIRLVRRDPDLMELLKKLEAIADEMTEEDDVISGDYNEE
jgi:hypothetical protein